MARKHQYGSTTSKNTDPNPDNINKGLHKAALFAVKEDGTIETSDSRAEFLLNPASLQDDVNSNWIKHSPPGSSDPVLQWLSGGSRTVTIEALITKDISPETGSGGDFVSDLKYAFEIALVMCLQKITHKILLDGMAMRWMLGLSLNEDWVLSGFSTSYYFYY